MCVGRARPGARAGVGPAGAQAAVTAERTLRDARILPETLPRACGVRSFLLAVVCDMQFPAPTVERWRVLPAMSRWRCPRLLSRLPEQGARTLRAHAAEETRRAGAAKAARGLLKESMAFRNGYG